jgi:hypothetical protein
MLCSLCTPNLSFAPGKGSAQFATDSLSASASTSQVMWFAFGNRSDGPTGASGFAVLNAFDVATGQFQQAETFELTVGTTKSILTMTAWPFGFNCAAGEVAEFTCEVTKASAVFHNVTSGTAKIPAFDQKYTTHGVSDTFNNLACELTAFGLTLSGDGSADRSRSHTTP